MEPNKKITPLIIILAIPLVIALFNIPILNTLWKYSFDDGTYSHSYLVPIIYAYLCYELYTNNQLELRDKINIPITILFVFSCYAFFVFSAAQISLAYWFTNILLIISSTLMLFRYHWKIVFPPAYFIFMYPLWGPMVNILQQLSVEAVSIIMGFTSIPVYVENQFVTIPAGLFEIAGGCSGLRYLITALAISSLYIFLYINKAKHVLLFLAFAIGGALLTNWIRITIIIMVGHYTDMQSELIEDHNMFGWYLFIPFMFLLFKFGNHLINDNENNTDIKTQEFKIVSKSNIIIALIGLTLSSTTLLATPVSSNPDTTKNKLQNFKLHPIVTGYSQLTIEQQKYNNTTLLMLVYDFDGKELDEKPTSISNNLANEHWNIVREENAESWQFSFLSNKKLNAIIATNYTIDGKRKTSRGKFKLLRIQKALLGSRNTQLNWVGAICQSDCLQEKSLIENK
ncbi:MAG: exosortase [gamma proteobacterium symbiont of Bathyaustriella thionipta]|nr:exosortase [gamma proteobacterium symbiont of Bathyaustriella thionipta]MCU7950862.1 exosortase [gamma proteobacterium symbiont of Bathyaustriella thionipta]MCU7952933.1 exosortase [gamma proteobacterium symbiont of Bathyaustriella thionipta]MCU7957998.1 exosortase [gamma proteobacterium symbiont of Bathyaustriella thionipta]MCU7965856.1 exosortase [gamma proteobacterium symbiont of Bathyaustriella thionipta]